MMETLKENILTIRSNHGSRDFLSKLNGYRQNNTFTDITLEVDASIRISAHKLVLSACSPYFDKMFATSWNFVEASASIVKLVGMDANSLKIIVDYMYTGCIAVTPTTDIANLIGATDLFLMNDLRTALTKYSQQTLTNSNCISRLMLGRIYSANDMISAALRFLRRNYLDVFVSSSILEFQKLTLEDLKYAITESAFVKNEETLLESILEWFKAHQTQPYSLSDELAEFVGTFQWKERTLNRFPEFVLKPLPLQSSSVKPRLSKYIIAVAFDSKEIEYLDLDHTEDGWNVLTDIPDMRYGLCGASLTTSGSKIFVTGGVGSGGIMKSLPRFLIYDLETNLWTKGPDLIRSRKCHASFVLDDRTLIVVGGTDSDGIVLTVETLNIVELGSTWIQGEIENVKQGFVNSGLVILDKKLTALSCYGGGSEDWNYDKEKRIWTRFEYERLTRDHPGIGTDPGQIRSAVLIGGAIDQSPLTEVEMFDQEQRSWIRLPNLNVPRENPGVVSVQEENTIYAIGGKGSDGSVEKMDGNKKEWELIPGLKLKFPDQEYVAAILNQS